MTPDRSDRAERRRGGNPSAGRRRVAPVNLLLVATGLFLALLLLESALRLFAPQTLERPLDIYAADPVYGHTLQPNLAGRVLATQEWTMHLWTTRAGFRRGALGETAPGAGNGPRVVGIGDSFMFGYGVEHEQTALDRARDILSSRSGRPVDTVNLGVPGYNVTHYLALLRGESPALDPEVVVVMLFANDFRRQADPAPYAVDAEGHLISERFSLRSPRTALLPIRAFFKTRSHAYLLLRDRSAALLQRLGLRPLEQPSLYRRDLDLEQRFAYTFDTVGEIHRFCDRHGIRLLLVLVPEKQQVVASYRRRVLAAYRQDAGRLDWRLPQDGWMGFCRQQGIECLDLAPVLERAGRSAATYFEVDLHWTRDGHAVAGEELARRLIELGWLSEAG